MDAIGDPDMYQSSGWSLLLDRLLQEWQSIGGC